MQEQDVASAISLPQSAKYHVECGCWGGAVLAFPCFFTRASISRLTRLRSLLFHDREGNHSSRAQQGGETEKNTETESGILAPEESLYLGDKCRLPIQLSTTD